MPCKKKTYLSSFTPNEKDEPEKKKCGGCQEYLPIKSFKPTRNQVREVNGVEYTGTVRNYKCIACESSRLTVDRSVKLSDLEDSVIKQEKNLKMVYSKLNDAIETLTRKVNSLEAELESLREGKPKVKSSMEDEVPSWMK